MGGEHTCPVVSPWQFYSCRFYTNNDILSATRAVQPLSIPLVSLRTLQLRENSAV